MNALQGRVWKFGDNIGGDDGIIQFSEVTDLGRFDEPALKRMCFARVRPEFRDQVRQGDLVVAGRNFAIQNHAHACVALKASGIICVVVESCDSGFLRKCLNIGLPVLVARGVSELVQDGDTLCVDLQTGLLRNATSGNTLQTRPYSPQMLDIWQSGGLVPYSRKHLATGS